MNDEDLKKCQAQCEEYLNGWKRAKADFVNYQKDEAKRLEEIAKFGNWELTRDLIAVLDSFDLAIAALEKDGKAEKGVYLIRGQLEDVLRNRGLEKIEVKAGQVFDPAFHEAVGETESDQPGGAVAEEISSGYLLNGRVIRPARVKLVKSKM
jgi:molecular chaperone GrpE